MIIPPMPGLETVTGDEFTPGAAVGTPPLPFEPAVSPGAVVTLVVKVVPSEPPAPCEGEDEEPEDGCWPGGVWKKAC